MQIPNMVPARMVRRLIFKSVKRRDPLYRLCVARFRRCKQRRTALMLEYSKVLWLGEATLIVEFDREIERLDRHHNRIKSRMFAIELALEEEFLRPPDQNTPAFLFAGAPLAIMLPRGYREALLGDSLEDFRARSRDITKWTTSHSLAFLNPACNSILSLLCFVHLVWTILYMYCCDSWDKYWRS